MGNIMTLNPYVTVDTTSSETVDTFYPEDGYVLWMDDEEGNLDPETGEPIYYWTRYAFFKTWHGEPYSEKRAPHIWAKLIEPGMEVCGTVPGKEETI